MSQSGYADAATSGAVRGQRRIGLALAPRNWRVGRRLIVLVAIPALLSLTLAGFRLADTLRTGAVYGRIGQVAALGQHVTGLAQAMQDERAATALFIADGRPAAGLATLDRQYLITDRRAVAVRRFTMRLGGGPAGTRSRAATILGDIAKLPGLRRAAAQSQAPALSVISGYSAAIQRLFVVNNDIAALSSSFALFTSARALDSLSRMQEHASLQQAILGAALAQGHFGPGALAALTTAEFQQANDLASFRSSATREQNRALTDTLAGPLAGQARAVEQRAIAAGDGALAFGSAARDQWAAGTSFTVGWMRHAEAQLASWIVGYARDMHRSAMRSAIVTAGLVLAAMLLVIVATVIISRSVVRPLRRLEAAAEHEAMRRASLTEMYVTLLRRSSSLVEPLLRMIDSFELDEVDPERLAALFQMDHLATRMRRISDSALVLAGDQAPHRWTEPVTLLDLLRAALSEIEQYDRVLLDVESAVPGTATAVVSASAAVDIVHMLAELLENATAFSPATTQVVMSGRTERGGGWLVSIADSGTGMPEEQLSQLNEQLARPPLADAAADGHMGLFTVAHLAARHDIRVAIAQPPGGGTTVQVHIPATLISRAARPVGRAGVAGEIPRPGTDPGPVTGTDAATRHDVALLGAPLPLLTPSGPRRETGPEPAANETEGLPVFDSVGTSLIPGTMVPLAATPDVSAQIARSRLTSFQHGSRRARADAQEARERSRED